MGCGVSVHRRPSEQSGAPQSVATTNRELQSREASLRHDGEAGAGAAVDNANISGGSSNSNANARPIAVGGAPPKLLQLQSVEHSNTSSTPDITADKLPETTATTPASDNNNNISLANRYAAAVQQQEARLNGSAGVYPGGALAMLMEQNSALNSDSSARALMGNGSMTSIPAKVSLQEALLLVTQNLNQRQREGVMEITKEEMERLVLVTRELENMKQMMKSSKYTVVGTWSILENENMLERFAQQMYDELLTRNPRLRVYFYGVDLDEQSRTLLRMLGTAVHFYEKPQAMVDMLTKAGARHRGYGVSKDTFVAMQNAFMKVFPKFVGQEVFDAAEKEWKKFWKLILDLLEHGSCSEEGAQYGRMYEEQNLKKLQSDFALLTERQNKCDPRHQFVGIMYAKAIEMYGDLSRFDALKDLRASRRVFQSYCDIIKNLGNRERTKEYMRELGARHVAYNVSLENLRSFTEPFLFACRHFLEDEWNVAMESRFLTFFQYMTEGVSEGMEAGMDSVENRRAPSNNATFCLLFTDIEASTKLWQRDQQAMSIAVKQHHRLIRSLIAEYGAYEVKTVGDSFIIAAKDVLVGTKIALAIELELMRMIPIAPDFQMVENTEGRGDPDAWDPRTLRVRIGVEHCTDAVATYDTIHRRYDYYGPSVNRCARIESAACGGQILMSRETFETLISIPEFHEEPCPGFFRQVEIPSPSVKLDSRGLDHFVAVSDVGLARLKGIGEPVHLVSMVPRCFAGRLFVDKVGRMSQKHSI